MRFRRFAPFTALLGTTLPLLLVFNGILTAPKEKTGIPPISDFHRQTIAANSEDSVLWTNWHPDQYALADDGESIWIGAAGGVVRWDKASNTYQRFAIPDELPLRTVLAVAVDAVDNRWFGGDGGLSQLDVDEHWTHYTSTNSDLYTNYVDAIAIGSDSTVWLSHELPDGSVSRLDTDGTWRWYPNRATAVTADYADITQTQNANGLWAVADDEVWVDYQVFDGIVWTERIPPGVSQDPIVVAADSGATVWVLADSQTVYSWNGTGWSEFPIYFPFDGSATTLAVGPDDSVWIGWEERAGWPYTNRTAGISQVPENPGGIDLDQYLGMPGPLTALLPTPAGMWGVGPAWLLQPDETITVFDDVPLYSDVTNVVVDENGVVWLHSQYVAPYNWGAVQTLDDGGSATLTDDQWQLIDRVPAVTAFEPTPNGDLWMTWQRRWRFPEPGYVWRRHQGVWIEYKPQFRFFATDIFAQNDRRVWFAYSTSEDKGVLALDDGGTATDLSDDVWITYPIDTDGSGGVVAIDGFGQLWYGDTLGLYRHNSATWETINSGRGVCDLAPAADGTLFVQRSSWSNPNSCEQPAQVILIVWPDGSQESLGTVLLVERHLDLVRSAYRRNQMWTVAPDGAVWYTVVGSAGELHHRNGAGLSVYPLPFSDYQVRNLEVDPNNHAWLVANSTLWRMSPLPDFVLDIRPNFWLLAPGGNRHGQVEVYSKGGYAELIWLEVIDLPNGVTATLDSNPVQAGQIATMGLEANAESALGTDNSTLRGTDNTLTHTVPFTVSVVTTVFEYYLPLVSK